MSAQITLVGRLTADPELRFTPNGLAAARFTVATSRRRRNQAGEWEDTDVTFWPVVAWDQLAEHIAETLTKGAAVIVVGQAHQNSWTTDDGQKHTRIEVRCDAVGPNLRWPAKPAQRVKPETGAQAPAEDPWANGGNDEPPF